MSKTVVLELGQDSAAPLRWSSIVDNRVIDGGERAGVLAVADVCDGADRLVAVLPGELVAMRVLASPPASMSKFRAAAQFLFEDELAAGVDNLHFVVSRNATGAGVIAGIDRAVLQEFREAFSEAGIEPDILTVDYSLAPQTQDGASLVVDRDRIFGSVKGAGIAAERPWADDLIDRALSNGEGMTVRVLCVDPAEVHTIAALENADVIIESLPDRALRYGKSALGSGVVNFLQGEFRKKRDWRAGLDPWKRAATLAAACLAVVIIGQFIAVSRDVRAANAIEARIADVHQAAFPDARGVSPVAHARNVLGNGGGGSGGFLSLTRVVATALDDNAQIQLQRIRYNGARSEYSIQLQFADINELENLKRVLTNQGLAVAETGGVRRSGGVYVGEIEVSAQ